MSLQKSGAGGLHVYEKRRKNDAEGKGRVLK